MGRKRKKAMGKDIVRASERNRKEEKERATD